MNRRNKTKDTGSKFLFPAVNLHRPIIRQVLMHLERIKQQVRLMAHTLLQTLKLGAVQVISKNRLVVRVCAVLDNDTSALSRRETTHISKALLCDNHVEIVLCLVDVCREGDDTRDTGGVGLGGTDGGSVHDGVARVTQEIGRPAETVQHARAEDAGGVCVRVDVYFDRGVHADAAQAADDFGGVGDALRAEKELVGIAVPVVVEALEAVGGETDGGGCGEVEVAAVEEVEEGVLEHFGPDLEVLEVSAALAQPTNHCVGDVSNARLQREEVVGETTMVDLVLEEVDQVTRDRLRSFILGRVGGRLVGVVTLDNGNDLLRVNGDVRSTDTVFGTHDHHGLAVRRLLRHIDIMQTLKRRRCRVHLNNNLIRHLHKLRRRTNRRTGDNPTILGNRRRLDNRNIKLTAGLVQRVPPVDQVLGEHAQMLIEELYPARVQSLGNLLADLVGTATLDHVQCCPAVFSLCAGRGTDE